MKELFYLIGCWFFSIDHAEFEAELDKSYTYFSTLATFNGIALALIYKHFEVFFLNDVTNGRFLYTHPHKLYI